MAGIYHHQVKRFIPLYSKFIPQFPLQKLSYPSKSFIVTRNYSFVKSTFQRGNYLHVNVSHRTLVTSPIVLSKNVEVAGTGTQLPVSGDILECIESVQQSTGNVGVIFSDSTPVIWTADFLCVLKDLPGMSWMGTIILGTILIRTLVGVPVYVTQQKSVGRLARLKPEFENLALELKKETAIAIKRFNWDEKVARRQFMKSYKKHWRKLVEENNCHPMRSLALSLVQLPVWICFSSALRNIVYALPLPRTTERLERWMQMYSEKTPWVDSLVMQDPLVFPAIFLIANLLNIEFARSQRLKNVPQTKLQIVLPWVFRGGLVFVAYIATQVPAAVSMYWATSSSIALAQSVLLSTGTARNIFNLPKISHPDSLKIKPLEVLEPTTQSQDPTGDASQPKKSALQKK